jgi:hypothetical protein
VSTIVSWAELLGAARDVTAHPDSPPTNWCGETTRAAVEHLFPSVGEARRALELVVDAEHRQALAGVPDSDVFTAAGQLATQTSPAQQVLHQHYHSTLREAMAALAACVDERESGQAVAEWALGSLAGPAAWREVVADPTVVWRAADALHRDGSARVRHAATTAMGEAYAEYARQLGISRQAVAQAAKRTPEEPEVELIIHGYPVRLPARVAGIGVTLATGQGLDPEVDDNTARVVVTKRTETVEYDDGGVEVTDWVLVHGQTDAWDDSLPQHRVRVRDMDPTLGGQVGYRLVVAASQVHLARAGIRL